MHRAFLGILALVLTVGLLAGCTARVDDNDNQTDSAEVSGGGSARGTPGFEPLLLIGGVLGAAGILAWRQRGREG